MSIKKVWHRYIDITFMYNHLYYSMMQGFGSFKFYLADPDLLDMNPPEDAINLEVSKWEIDQQSLG